MYVVATAGHVDHGKSTLVRALTGMEPDRLSEERRRGLTIDLGFAWTELPSGREVAFVDVPGHERFLGNMLAGVGPAPVVCFVVAADKGWQAQSSDHRDAVAALGIAHGMIVVTRADRATPEQIAETLRQTRLMLAGTPLAHAPEVVVSCAAQATELSDTADAATPASTGLDALVAKLDDLLGRTPAPDAEARVRLWVDRSFSIRGAGTVVTGTLTAGTLRRGDELELVAAGAGATGSAWRTVGVRGLQSRGAAHETVPPHARVAVNLRDLSADEVGRGDALVTPGGWSAVRTVDVRRTTGTTMSEAPQHIVAHIGTAAVPARLRPLGDDHARIALDRPLPLQFGDRFVLRGSGSRSVLAGVLVLDVDPPGLRRRGDGARRAAELAGRSERGDPGAEVARRGAVRVEQLRRYGLDVSDEPGIPDAVGFSVRGERWLANRAAVQRWAGALRAAVDEELRRDPLAPGLPQGAAAEILTRSQPTKRGQQHPPPLPDAALLPVVVRIAGLDAGRGVIRPPDRTADLGGAEVGVAELEDRLRARPFAAPEADDLAALGLGPRELAAAERLGRLLRLRDGVILLPDAPAQAMRRIAALEQPFTTSQARQTLDTTRRVAIPLLEHLDARGWTRRIDGTRRTVVR